MTDTSTRAREDDGADDSEWNGKGGVRDSHPILRRLLHAMATIPGLKVDRRTFLGKQLDRHYYQNSIEVGKAIATTPLAAGVPMETLDRMADAVIMSHIVKASSVSFAAGLPGGWLMAATLPVDLAQLNWHAVVCAQKLMYLYGWDDLFDDGDLQLNEETEVRIWLLIGAVFGVRQATYSLREIAYASKSNAAYRIAKIRLTATPLYIPLRYALFRTIGVRLTKTSFAKGLSKLVPLAGGGISASITAVSLRSMTRNLKEYLKDIAI
ncbi:MAG: hypothetical protein F4X20_05070 [Dehalococcoidia bacterium]|nr:hypothetical protein [Dehalococcoidia bacterium]